MTTIFDSITRINLAVIGHGKVGSEFIDQVLQAHDSLIERKGIDLRIFAIANSKQCLINSDGIGNDWRTAIRLTAECSDIHSLITQHAQDNDLEHLILVDNTSSEDVARSYLHYISLGYDIVSSNKKPNTLPWVEYQSIRRGLEQYGSTYRYETNVGAGLPLIDNIKMLHLSGERIRRIRGVYSGSLSYIFNQLDDRPTSDLREIIREAIELGYAEPDVREDLSGEDVARKLLILARELDIAWQLQDVHAVNLVPPTLRTMSREEFDAHISVFIDSIKTIQTQAPEGHVLRYIGEVVWDDERERAALSASLQYVPRLSTLGALSAADCCFEIYTESYGDRPITVKGAGAGVKVTARGVFGDVLRLC